jgi:MFS family permease
MGFSIAGDAAPERAGEASSVVSFVGYGAFLLGPVVVGTLAQATTLRLALGLVVVAGALIAALSLRLASTRQE